MVNDSKFVFNTDVQAVQALQLTIVFIYLKNTRGKMIMKLNSRMDGEICSLSRKPKLQVSVLIFVLKSVFLWFFYFQVEFMTTRGSSRDL